MRNPKNNRSSRSQASGRSASTARNAASKKSSQKLTKLQEKALQVVADVDKQAFLEHAALILEELHGFSQLDLAKMMRNLTHLFVKSGYNNDSITSESVYYFGRLSELVVYLASNSAMLEEIGDHLEESSNLLLEMKIADGTILEEV